MRVPSLASVLVLFLLMLPCVYDDARVAAQNASNSEEDAGIQDPAYARQLPFADGERHEFAVRFGVLPAGRATLSVLGTEDVRGTDALRLEMNVNGGVPGARVRNRFTSWVEPRPFRSLRFHQEMDELGTERSRQYDIHGGAGFSVLHHEDGEREDVPTSLPLDDVSFIYFARTLPLEVGDRYVLPRYFRDSGNPVVIEVVRRERVSVPAATYDAIVIRPHFQSSGLFGEGGEAEVYLSDDWSRVVVRVTSRVSRLGSLTFNLLKDPRLP